MIILHEFALLAAETSRTKAYLQMMIKNGYKPSYCIIFIENHQDYIENAKNYQSYRCKEMFDKDEPILKTVTKNEIPYELIETTDINSDIMFNCIKRLKEKYLIYSGYSGYIIEASLLNIGKKFIHIHAGMLPQYRGSTTAYYSMLKEKRIGATAIFMSPGIDEGDMITQKAYPVPIDCKDIDYEFEPYVRAKVLVKAIDAYVKNKRFDVKRQNSDDAETYFIIHPVLKHIAIMNER